jgi:hypothetical protein
MPDETVRGEWRRHPLPELLGKEVTCTVTGILAVGGGVAVLTGGGWWMYVVVAAAAVAVGAALVARRFPAWYHDRIVLTNRRLMVITGLRTRTAAAVPLSLAAEMRYRQSAAGRFLNWGAFLLEVAHPDPRVRQFKHLSDPNKLYRHLAEELLDPAAVEARIRAGQQRRRCPGGRC